jgi:hypothetical protein
MLFGVRTQVREFLAKEGKNVAGVTYAKLLLARLRFGQVLKYVTWGLNRLLSIFSNFIFDSNVEEGMPRSVAAPKGPDTRPLLSRSAASMASLC